MIPHSQKYLSRSTSAEVDVWRRVPPSEASQRALISVIVPVFREEKILRRTLEIFTPQLCEEFHIELIVSDGGSDDATVNIAKEFADIVVVHTNKQRRQTIAEGRNRGAEVASGATLVFLNGDTLPAEPKLFFHAINRWTLLSGEYEECGALACPVEVMPSERKWSDTLFHIFFNNYLRLLSKLGAGVGRGECQISRADVFRAVGGYNAGLAAGEDFDLFRRIAQKHRIAIPMELVVYESPRRYRRFGYARILWSWFMNFMGVTFFSKSISKEWEPVR